MNLQYQYQKASDYTQKLDIPWYTDPSRDAVQALRSNIVEVEVEAMCCLEVTW